MLTDSAALISGGDVDLKLLRMAGAFNPAADAYQVSAIVSGDHAGCIRTLFFPPVLGPLGEGTEKRCQLFLLGNSNLKGYLHLRSLPQSVFLYINIHRDVFLCKCFFHFPQKISGPHADRQLGRV
jgi:hypothetical protein